MYAMPGESVINTENFYFKGSIENRINTLEKIIKILKEDDLNVFIRGSILIDKTHIVSQEEHNKKVREKLQPYLDNEKKKTFNAAKRKLNQLQKDKELMALALRTNLDETIC